VTGEHGTAWAASATPLGCHGSRLVLSLSLELSHDTAHVSEPTPGYSTGLVESVGVAVVSLDLDGDAVAIGPRAADHYTRHVSHLSHVGISRSP
jgi:hypothetical protein